MVMRERVELAPDGFGVLAVLGFFGGRVGAGRGRAGVGVGGGWGQVGAGDGARVRRWCVAAGEGCGDARRRRWLPGRRWRVFMARPPSGAVSSMACRRLTVVDLGLDASCVVTCGLVGQLARESQSRWWARICLVRSLSSVGGCPSSERLQMSSSDSAPRVVGASFGGGRWRPRPGGGFPRRVRRAGRCRRRRGRRRGRRRPGRGWSTRWATSTMAWVRWWSSRSPSTSHAPPPSTHLGERLPR